MATKDEYDFKIIICNDEVEKYEYEKIIRRGFERKPKRKFIFTKRTTYKQLMDHIEKITKKKKSNFSLQRARTEIRRLINSNPDFNKFHTFTFDSKRFGKEVCELSSANKLFKTFIRRFKRRYSNIKYLAVPEFQKDVDFYGRKKEHGGAVHYHMLCVMKYIKANELEDIWQYGFVKPKATRKIKNLGVYLCKYLGKSIDDKRYFNKKKYHCSNNLNQPIELIGWKAGEFWRANEKKLALQYESKFENDYIGKVDYQIFKFTNKEKAHDSLE